MNVPTHSDIAEALARFPQTLAVFMDDDNESLASFISLSDEVEAIFDDEVACEEDGRDLDGEYQTAFNILTRVFGCPTGAYLVKIEGASAELEEYIPF